MKKWVCGICGYVYDEEKEGIPFEQLPDGWVCPLCGAEKSAFAVQEDGGVKAEAPAPKIVLDGEMQELSAGALSALCSNLARGCEKQYHEAEAALFRELAEFFAAGAPAPEGDVDALLGLIQRDLQEGYPALVAAAKAESDRGTQRICVWGEKVTRILDSLLSRYRREGEAFLQNTGVWACTVCGFVYVGEAPPQLCPVCKVPSWKFENVEGGAA